jgi:hypothetical protein
VTISGGDGANNQVYPSAIGLGAGAVGLYDYTGTTYTWGALRWEGAYKVVYFSFGFEAINAAATRASVMDKVLTWLEGGATPPTDTPIPPTATATPTPTATSVAPTATPTTTPIPPTPTPTPSSSDVIYVSSSTDGNAGGVAFADEDILSYDRSTGVWAMVFDGSDVGRTVDLNAFHFLSDGSILMSFDAAGTISGLGTVDDSDIVRFTPTSLGATTAGTFAWYFDGSDVGLTTTGEDIDGLTVLPDGRLIISTEGNPNASGVSGGDEDLLVFTPTSLGSTTSGTWALYFDGSDVGLTTTNENLVGVWSAIANGPVYLSTLGAFSVSGVSGDGADIFICTPGSLGGTTSCTFSMYWDGSANGFAGEVVDDLFIVRPTQ